MMQKLGLISSKGVFIAGVFQDSPADRAGLKKGDVIIAYQGKDIPDAGNLSK